MVRRREDMHKHLTRHAVTVLLVRPLPAGRIGLYAPITTVAWKKEAAP